MGRCYEYIKGAHHRDDIAPLTNKEIQVGRWGEGYHNTTNNDITVHKQN